MSDAVDPGREATAGDDAVPESGGATGAPLGPHGIAALDDRFRQHLEEVTAPLRSGLDRYVQELEKAVAAMDEVARTTPLGQEENAVDQARSEARSRLRYAERFHTRFGKALFDHADMARTDLFHRLDRVSDTAPPFPDTVLALDPSEPAVAPDLVRPGWTHRFATAFSHPTERAIPVRLLAELYLVELSRRLEQAANDVARLTAMAIGAVRRQLHEHTDLGGDAGLPPDLDGEATDVVRQVDGALKEVHDEFGRAIRATALQVPEHRFDGLRAQAATKRARLLDEWTSFETALMANVAAEGVLARALASMEATVAAAAREFEGARDAGGAAPLERLADGLAELGDRAEQELPDGDTNAVLEALATDARALFEAEVPTIRRLRPRLEELAGEVTEALAEVPGLVPDDLQISEHPVPEIPGRPRKLQLRDAPLEELLSTACAGTLPRWVEKALAAALAELEAMGKELQRIRNAVDFQLRAPLRGGFDRDGILALASGIIDRTVAQLEDLRAQGLASIDNLVTGLEERAREEADALRSAVANREFLRIQSEIAEEQAVRQLSTGVERAQSAAVRLGRGATRAWAAGREAVTAIQSWAERQLGVDEVEREEMLESLEQSLLGEDQQVVAALPSMYRQLFDVEAGVPWDELLVPRDEGIEVIQRAFDRWSEDRSSTLAIVGEKGSGKTTLVRLARQQVFGDTPVREVELGRSIDDPAELEKRLAEAFDLDAPRNVVEAIDRQDPAVAVVEGLHHLFVRALGGFDAMEAFLEIVAATSAKVLWVVTIDESAWRYLNRVVGIESHFVHKVSTTNLSAEKLERAIMARHEVSGFALQFETELEDARDGPWARLLGREARGELTRKETQRRRYFQQLAAIAEGNIVLALFYWLRSIRRMEEHVLVLGDPEIIDLEFLERLPLEHLHTIAAIILHGGLSKAAHRRVFQIPAAESRLQLAALADSHMIFLARDGEYKINKVLYRPFIRLLAARNIF